MKASLYYQCFDPRVLASRFPAGAEFLPAFSKMSQDELRAGQNELFVRAVARAWQIPFYQRLWGDAGLEPGDILGIDDIGKLPSFGKQEIMEGIERVPPFGDHHGRDIPVNGRQVPMVVHTTSGTTGRPQPLVFSPKTREIQALLLGRLYALQGVNANDIVHSVYGHGLINGGHYIREAFTKYTSALFLSAGTGVETPSVKQVELMRDFGVTVLTGFGDYLSRLAQVAIEQGIDPQRDIRIRSIIGHLSDETRISLRNAWGSDVEMFDWYGVGDTGAIAGEGPDHDGMYVMEDAQYLEVCDIDTGDPVEVGDTGDMVVTCLYVDDIFPIIRFNTHDITRVLPGESSLGLPFRRIAGFLGRSDSMLKLKGINIFPQAVGNFLRDIPSFAGDYLFVRKIGTNGKEVVTVRIESHERGPSEADRFQNRLKLGLGIELPVELVVPGALASLTGIETRQKPVRLIDEHGS